MRADGLARGEREPLGLVDAPLRQQQLGQGALRLAERRRSSSGARMRIDSRKSRSALASSPLCRAVQAAKLSVRPSDQAAPASARCSRAASSAASASSSSRRCRWSWPAKRSARPRASALPLSSASRIACSISGCRAVELEPGEVDARELVGGLALEVLVLGRRARARAPRASPAPPWPGRRASRRSWRAPAARGSGRCGRRARAPRARCRSSARRRSTSASRSTAASARVTSARPCVQPSPSCDRGGEHLLHLARDRRQVAEPVGRAGGEVAAAQRRLELDRADEVLARGAVRLAGERAQAGLGRAPRPPPAAARPARRRRARRAARVARSRWKARISSSSSPARSFSHSAKRAWCSARADLESPEYATSRIRTCLNL